MVNFWTQSMFQVSLISGSCSSRTNKANNIHAMIMIPITKPPILLFTIFNLEKINYINFLDFTT